MNKKLIFLIVCLIANTFSNKSLAFGVIMGAPFSEYVIIEVNHRSYEEAENAAKSRCFGKCDYKFQFKNTCGAWATDGGFVYFPGEKSTLIEAESHSIRVCNFYLRSTSCTVRASGCDGEKYLKAEQKEREKRWAEEQDARTKAEIKKAASCLGYKAAKFICASAGNIDACMDIRFGANHMSYAHSCQ